MTPEQTAAYINAQTTLCQIELAGMLAENQYRTSCGRSIAYGEDGFQALYEKYTSVLGHNSLMTLFNGASE